MLKYDLGNYHADSHETRKNLSALHGEQARDFCCNLTPKIVTFSKTRFIQTKVVINSWNLLQAWTRITVFMSIPTTISFDDDKDIMVKK